MAKAITETLPVARGPYRLYAEAEAGEGVPVVLMHGFPDNTHLYDRLVPYLASAGLSFASTSWAGADRTSRKVIPTRPPTRQATWQRL